MKVHNLNVGETFCVVFVLLVSAKVFSGYSILHSPKHSLRYTGDSKLPPGVRVNGVCPMMD